MCTKFQCVQCLLSICGLGDNGQFSLWVMPTGSYGSCIDQNKYRETPPYAYLIIKATFLPQQIANTFSYVLTVIAGNLPCTVNSTVETQH